MKSNSGRSALLAMSLICIFLLAACGSSTPVLRYITISPSNQTIATGTTLQFTATGYYSNGSITPGIGVSWSSSSTAVASMNGTTGVAMGLTVGTTTITATALGITSGTTTLNVAGLTSIAVTPATTTISIGATQQYDAVATYTSSSGTTGTEDVTAQATWTSSSTAVATMNTSTPGLATAVAGGTTTITAAIGTVTGSATLNVTAAVSLVVSPLVSPPVPITPPFSVNVAGNFPLVVQEKLANGTLQPPTLPVTWSSSTATQANVVGYGTNNADAIVAGFAPSGGTTPVTITAAEGQVSGTTTFTVVTGASQFAYLTNTGGNSISSYTVTASTTPYLTSTGAATPAANATLTFLNPSGLYLYEIELNGGRTVSDLWVYNVNSSTGAISQTTGITQPQVAGAGGFNVGVTDPYGRFVYVSDDGSVAGTAGTINGFTVDQTTGALAPITAVTGFNTNVNVPKAMVIDHTGSYLYVVNFGPIPTGGASPSAGTISAYSIDPTTGNLTALSAATYPVGKGATYATLDPTGTYLYVANSADNTISAYSIGAGGALTSLLSTARAVPGVTAGSAVTSLAVSPNGSYLYALDSGHNQVFGFSVSAGVPSTTVISGTPIATGTLPTNMAIDPTGVLMVVPNVGDTVNPSTVSLFTIGPTGALTSATPPTVAAGVSPGYIVFYNGL
jgi:6-phosphogluconolactonase (cycloisomerase 2 family)